MRGHVREDAPACRRGCVARPPGVAVRKSVTCVCQLGGASSGGERRSQCCYAPHDRRAANGLREAEFSLWPPLEKGIHEFKWKPAGTQSDYRLFTQKWAVSCSSSSPFDDFIAGCFSFLGRFRSGWRSKVAVCKLKPF